jgi:hypothetical protein
VIYSPRRGAPIYTFVDHDQIFEQQVLFNREPTNIFKDWCNMIKFFPLAIILHILYIFVHCTCVCTVLILSKPCLNIMLFYQVANNSKK